MIEGNGVCLSPGPIGGCAGPCTRKSARTGGIRGEQHAAQGQGRLWNEESLPAAVPGSELRFSTLYLFSLVATILYVVYYL